MGDFLLDEMNLRMKRKNLRVGTLGHEEEELENVGR